MLFTGSSPSDAPMDSTSSVADPTKRAFLSRAATLATAVTLGGLTPPIAEAAQDYYSNYYLLCMYP